MNKRENTTHILPVLIPLAISIFISAALVGSMFFFWGNSYKQVNREGVIKIVARYVPPRSTSGSGVAFRLRVETHSGEFEIYDMKRLTFLRIDDGPLFPAAKWIPSGKGHHINGIVVFDQKLSKGENNLQIVVRGIDGRGDRILEWQIHSRS